MDALKLATAGLIVTFTTLAEAKNKPDLYAYATFYSGDFGIVDINTGSFVLCGNIGSNPVGLAAAADGTLITENVNTGEVYSVNPNTGALTDIGPSGITTGVFLGSTLSAVFEIDQASNVYIINTGTGAATRIGATGVPVNENYTVSASTGSKKLYWTNAYELLSISAKNGKAKSLAPDTIIFGGTVYTAKTLYGGSTSTPYGLYSINTSTGATALVSTLTGESSPFFGLVPAPASAQNGCALK